MHFLVNDQLVIYFFNCPLSVTRIKDFYDAKCPTPVLSVDYISIRFKNPKYSLDSDMADHQLHAFLFPLMAHGHMIPMLDIAKLFASRGVKTTIITTPHNAPFFAKTTTQQIIKYSTSVHISLRVIRFPAVEAGLPLGCENLDQLTSREMLPGFVKATVMLQEPLEHLLREFHPNFLVADMFFPWATEVAAKFDIPRLVFHGTSFFAPCASQSLLLNKPFKKVSSESEHFVIPDLPHEIKLTREQVDPHVLQETETLTEFSKLCNQIEDSELRSHGAIVNSFYELEPEYADHYRKVLKKKAWHIGPVSLCNREVEDKAQRGKATSVDEHECLKWLALKKPESVVYVCFGSVIGFSASQMFEIAMAIEASEHDFIWVVRKAKDKELKEEDDDLKWLPEGFEERMKGKCLIIRGWAPQVLILDQQAIGGFVTHCGWNSILEGVCGGLPMMTWPVFAEQFYNEKLVTEVLRVGVAIGGQEMNILGSNERVIGREDIKKTVRRIMVGEEAEEMRERAKALKEMASKAVEEGGSSYSDLNALIQDLSSMALES